MTDIKIIKYLPEHYDEANSIVKQGWLLAYKNIIPTDIILTRFKKRDTDPLHRKKQIEMIKNMTHSYVAVKDKKVIGFIYFANIDKTKDINPVHNYMEIKVLYVDTRSHRMGIGKALFDFAINVMKDNLANRCLVSTLKGNVIGQNFYKKMGGKIIGEDVFIVENLTLPTVIYEFKI